MCVSRSPPDGCCERQSGRYNKRRLPNGLCFLACRGGRRVPPAPLRGARKRPLTQPRIQGLWMAGGAPGLPGRPPSASAGQGVPGPPPPVAVVRPTGVCPRETSVWEVVGALSSWTWRLGDQLSEHLREPVTKRSEPSVLGPRGGGQRGARPSPEEGLVLPATCGRHALERAALCSTPSAWAALPGRLCPGGCAPGAGPGARAAHGEPHPVCLGVRPEVKM
ncbi:hypothetical protein HJG60_008115 [Phyllostomus discolor]|uniref:Uncharacterized protein n=1 Tax=Phyllostomus discolor TaxID=89673 RepID=A0A833Z900_9CHIR|nr:hypothetical protein HJG60_008115 [Phyllostomus discolor]